ncbi:hypothetical protein BH09BAC4_BH09BAC4_04140 [soil metagenome]
MRFVEKDLSDPPAILVENQTLIDLEAIAKSGNGEAIKTKTYQGTYKDVAGKTQSKVRDKLNLAYHGKCAYCETFTKAEIEHYRPKKAVNESPDHKGYYWLCYEWSNLIPSCHDCNTSGGKANKFPIQGIRVIAPLFDLNRVLAKNENLANEPLLMSEEPFLLHPEIDDPNTFFDFAIDVKQEGIELQGLDGADGRGEMTIRICNLNRQSLRLDRLQNVISHIVSQINSAFGLAASSELTMSELVKTLRVLFKQLDENTQNVHLSHTLLRKRIIESEGSFGRLVIPLLHPDQQPLVLAAYRKYRNGL